VTVEPLRVISSQRRLEILRLLWNDEMSAGDIAVRFEVTWGAISQHLTVLKKAGFITERRDGNHRLYRADHLALGHLRVIVEEQWRGDLGRLKTLAEAEQREKGTR
jgi:DNA-binding transcriptional ArsR family regulator